MFDEPRLLVVDDEDRICQACGRIFSAQGFLVETSNDAHLGLRLASRNDYTAVLLDIRMPGMDGIQVLEGLRRRKPDVPVIIITGFPSVPDAAAARRLHASAYVTKPFTPEGITEVVRTSLRSQRAMGEDEPASAPSRLDPYPPAEEQRGSRDKLWPQLEKTEPGNVAPMLARPERAQANVGWLWWIGERVNQILPVRGLTIGQKVLAYGYVSTIGGLIGSFSGALLAQIVLGLLAVAIPRSVLAAKGIEPVVGAIAFFGGMMIGILGSIRLVNRLERTCRHAPARCKECGYNLTGNVSGTCPECGTPFKDSMREFREDNLDASGCHDTPRRVTRRE